MKFAFYKGYGTVLDKAICLWERGPYSHVEAILKSHSDGRYLVASSVPGIGVRLDVIKLPAEDWDIIEGPGDEAAVQDWFFKHAGAGYDYRGLFGFVLRPITGDKGEYFCSEAICTALGFNEPWRFDPNAFADSLRFAYAGKLNVY